MPAFESEAISLYKMFTHESGMIGFRVPNYQRTYDWGEENIRRLFEDFMSGIRELCSHEDAKTFLGSVILFNEAANREPSFDGNSFSVIDGQQRLTTTSLLALRLHALLTVKLRELPEIHESVKEWLENEIGYLLRRLAGCIYGLVTPDGVEQFPFPRIVRDVDCRGASTSASEYRTIVSKYLYGYSRHVFDRITDEYEFDDSQFTDGVGKRFVFNVGLIDQYVQSILNRDDQEESGLAFDPIELEHFLRAGVRGVFSKLPQGQSTQNSMLAIATGEHGEMLGGLLTLVAFANYMLDSVIVTRVVAVEERYAFDIFDALNTTGEPLTAIETFKPRVIEFEAGTPQARYEGSDSEISMSEIESYLSSFEKNADRQGEAQDIVITFALYLTGSQISKGLNVQRGYLRREYLSIPRSELDAKRKFVSGMADVTDYRKRFWKNVRMVSELRDASDRDLLLMLLSVLSETKHSLSMPILCRYYVESQRTGDWSIFSSAVKALTAFIVIRRSATGGTASIDSVLRILMSRGLPDRRANSGLKTGTRSDRDAVGIIEFRQILISWLEKAPIRIRNRDSWKEKASIQGLYGHSAPLCKFMLLAAAHNARPMGSSPTRLAKSRPSSETDYLNYSRWQSEAVETVEHVAPQNDTDRNWERAIYEEPHLINSIGNLTLLPQDENSAVGNHPWIKKRAFYRAFSAPDHDAVIAAIEQAKLEGVAFGNAENMLLDAHQLPIASTIAASEEWSSHIIKDRTSDLLDLVWEEISPWLYS